MINCPICNKEVKNLGAHTRLAHKEEWAKRNAPKKEIIAEVGGVPLKEIIKDTKPLPKPPSKLTTFLTDFKETMQNKAERLGIVIQLLVYSGIVAGFMGGIVYTQGALAAEMPFLWLSIILGILVIAVRKDLTFNLKFMILKKLGRNPRVIFHVDGSKVITRMVTGYNPSTSTIKMGKPSFDIEVTPEALLTENNYGVPAAIHIGSEKNLTNLFKEASDYFTAKQVDLMVKDAEQLGELKSTEKLDKLVQLGYLIAGAALIGTVFAIITWTSVGELQSSFEAIYPLLQQIPTLLKNGLV